jgi:hypothetical protein
MARWTDDRMDTLSGKVDGLGYEVDALGQRVGRLEHTVDELRREMHAEFRAVRTEMQSEFRAVRSEIKMLQVTMIGGFVSILAAIAGRFVTQL